MAEKSLIEYQVGIAAAMGLAIRGVKRVVVSGVRCLSNDLNASIFVFVLGILVRFLISLYIYIQILT